jgi:hypothetical protein
MNNSNFVITAGLRALAASKQKTQVIWILAGCSLLLIARVNYLRKQNLELKADGYIRDAKNEGLQKHVNTIENRLEKRDQENISLVRKIVEMQKENESNKPTTN